ncbi:MAG: PilZ domain-containing protein [Spirochaetales bacterium]|nr:PilZ domain-containing protein [Spirochaetales bacterium]MCF7937565.1 PilZ domain-containing protein [Spirochaetales bacterium]
MNVILQFQRNMDFFPEENPVNNFVVLGVFGGIVLAMILAYIVSSKKNRGNGTSPAKTRKYRKGAFRRQAQAAGLNQNHIKLLESTIKKYDLRDPMRLLQGGSSLNRIVQQSVQELDQSQIEESKKENLKYLFFQIKQIIDRNAAHGKGGYNSSRQLRLGQEVLLRSESGDDYPSLVTSNLKDLLAVQAPENEHGTEVRWRKGTKVQIFFWRGNTERYSFTTKVLGYNSIQGVLSLFVQHSKTIKSAKQRRFPRKEIDKPCYFYPITIVETGKGRHKKREATVEKNRRHLGSLQDVSAGGCSIRTTTPLKPGRLIRLDFDIERRKTLTVYGKILKVRRFPSRGGIMHIMFTRSAKKNINKINEYVYGITEEAG